MDLSQPLVRSEGNLDPIDGYVIFRILQQTNGSSGVLKNEIADYKKIVDMKCQAYTSSDTLDLGMTLWTAHWFADEEEWAWTLRTAAERDMKILFHETGYLEMPIRRRLAFREFGTCLGIRVGSDTGLKPVATQITEAWEKAGRVPIPKSGSGSDSLEPIDLSQFFVYCEKV